MKLTLVTFTGTALAMDDVVIVFFCPSLTWVILSI
jgi:hypothetical protein